MLWVSFWLGGSFLRLIIVGSAMGYPGFSWWYELVQIVAWPIAAPLELIKMQRAVANETKESTGPVRQALVMRWIAALGEQVQSMQRSPEYAQWCLGRAARGHKPEEFVRHIEQSVIQQHQEYTAQSPAPAGHPDP